MEEQAPKDYTKRRASQHVSLDRIQRRLETVLSRESGHLLDLSYEGRLDKTGLDSLDKCLKLVRILKKMRDDIPDEELEQLSKKIEAESDEE